MTRHKMRYRDGVRDDLRYINDKPTDLSLTAEEIQKLSTDQVMMIKQEIIRREVK